MAKKAIKPFYKSKTFWFAVLQFGFAVGLLILNEYQTAGTLGITGVLTIICRYYTENPIQF